MVSVRVVSGIGEGEAGPNAAAGLNAPRRDRVRVSATVRILVAAVKAQASPVCSHTWVVAPSGLMARACPNGRSILHGSSEAGQLRFGSVRALASSRFSLSQDGERAHDGRSLAGPLPAGRHT
jgi:hypothetical protein